MNITKKKKRGFLRAMIGDGVDNSMGAGSITQ